MIQPKRGVGAVAFLTLVAWAFAPASAFAQTDVTGAWIVTVDTPQGKNDFDVTFNQTGEKVAGQVTSPLGSVDFAGTLIKTDLTITYMLPVQGQNLEVKMTGVVDKDAIAGSLDLGGLAQLPWSAKRKPAQAAAAAAPPAAASASRPGSLTDVTGKWNITLMVGTNPLPMTGTLKQEGEAVSGSINSPLGELPVTGTMTGSNVALRFSAQTPQGELAVTLTGALGADGLAGKSSVSGLGESDWTAKRID